MKKLNRQECIFELQKSELKQEIVSVLSVAQYKLVRLEVDSLCFGNAIVEVVKDSRALRFIYDRGDIYCERKLMEPNTWGDQALLFSHTEHTDNQYSLLLRAIREKLLKA